MSVRKVTPEVLAEMIRMRRDGMKLAAIARRLRIDERYVSELLSANGVSDPESEPRRAKREKILRLRAKGWSYVRIADDLDVSVSNVHYHANHERRKAQNRAKWSARKAREKARATGV